MRRILALAGLLMICPLLAGTAKAQPSSKGIVDAWSLSDSGRATNPTTAEGVTILPTFWVDFSQTVGATITANTGQTLTRHGAPVRVADGTWPAGLSGAQGYAETLDGVSDYWTSTIAPPAGSFSAICVVTPSSVAAADHYLIGNFNPTGNLRGWRLYLNAATANFDISDDGTAAGGHITTVTKAASVAVGRRSFISVTVDTTAGDAHVAVSLAVDALAAATSTTADGPVFASAANLSVGAAADGSSPYAGAALDCRTFAGVLSAATVAQLRNQWLGTTSSGGNALTVTSASPPAVMVAAPASGTEPFLVDMPANVSEVGSPAASSGGLAASKGCSNLCQYGSFLTALTGWTETPTSTGDCAAVTTTGAHGTTAAICTNADADDAIKLTSACLTVTGATAYYADAFAKKVSGTALLDLNVIEDDSADCATPTTTTAVVNDAVPTTSWGHFGNTITTQAGTIRAQVQVSLPAAAAQVLDVDAVRLFAGAVDSLCYCYTDAAATAVCTADFDSPATKITAGSWTIRGTWQQSSDGAPADAVCLYKVTGTGGEKNAVYVYQSSDAIVCVVYDSAGAAKVSVATAAVSANEDWDFYCSHSSEGNVVACAKLHSDAAWTCDATPATGALTIKPSATTYIGSDGATPGNAYIRDVVLYRRVVTP